jgi:hypothetical protein
MFRFEKLDVWQKAVDEELARMLSGLKASLLRQSS